MNMVYDSEHFTVFAYPTQQGFELLDKDGHRSMYIEGAVARGFFEALDQIPEAERDQDRIDDFLDEYCAGNAVPISIH